MNEYERGSGGMILTGETEVPGIKIVSVSPGPKTYPTWDGLGEVLLV